MVCVRVSYFVFLKSNIFFNAHSKDLGAGAIGSKFEVMFLKHLLNKCIFIMHMQKNLYKFLKLYVMHSL